MPALSNLDFDLTDDQGNRRRLSDYTGKLALIFSASPTARLSVHERSENCRKCWTCSVPTRTG
jgi:hypothetical protein